MDVKYEIIRGKRIQDQLDNAENTFQITEQNVRNAVFDAFDGQRMPNKAHADDPLLFVQETATGSAVIDEVTMGVGEFETHVEEESLKEAIPPTSLPKKLLVSLEKKPIPSQATPGLDGFSPKVKSFSEKPLSVFSSSWRFRSNSLRSITSARKTSNSRAFCFSIF